MKKSKLLIVIGHSASKQGAVNYLGESEWSFNCRIYNKVKAKLSDHGIDIPVTVRDNSESYSVFCRNVNKIVQLNNVKVTLHLHFNSYTSMAKGCEVLMLDTDSKLDDLIGGHIVNSLHDNYNFKLRHTNGIKYLDERSRGYKMLKAVKDAGAVGVIVEPTFGNVRHKESKLIFENEDLYVDVLVESILYVLHIEEFNNE